jgi:hypothetical protein
MTNVTSPSAARLRTAIDRRVATARIVHGLGIAGRIGCIAASAWAAALLIGFFAGEADARLVAGSVLAAAAIAAWFLFRRATASWPTRLSIALAAERAQPEVGERISRAIDFLDDTPAGGACSTALKAIAIEQAADAADRLATAPIEGAARHLGFAAAAAVALALFTIASPRRDAASTSATATTQAPGVDSSPAKARPAFEPRSEAGQAAARIAALAAFERRLADSLAGWFAEAPGLAPIDASPRRRRAIAEAAMLHDDCMAGVSSAAQAITAATAADANGAAAALGKAMADLTRDADAAQEIVSAAICDHRLAAAAEAASHLADRLAAAAGLLGLPVGDAGHQVFPEQQPTAGPAPTSLDRDSRALIDRLARLDRAVTSASIAEGFDVTERGVAPPSAAPAGSAAGPGGGASAESPQPGGLAPGGDGIERVWSLVPEQSLPLRPRAADAATFPSHRRAIDAYYRLLLEQKRPQP